MTNGVVNLLWTGGWDSTYRLLDLVLVQKRKVQPYYVISEVRQSSKLEVKTMDKIRSLILQKDPSTKDLLLPTIYKEMSKIGENDTITQRFKRLAGSKYLGNQYDYLGRFADEAGVSALELSVHKDDHAQKFLQPFVVPCEGGSNYELAPESYNTDLSLFKYFRFPILDLTKVDMQERAATHGFTSIMEETVFCHTPLANGKPCGTCNPCQYTVKEGLGRRLPFTSKLRYGYVAYVKPPIKKVLKTLGLR